MNGLEVRAMRPNDIPAVAGLQRSCFPPPFPEDLLWTEDHLHAHLRVFPEGQLVAATPEIVASASSLRISEASWQAHRNWESTVGGHELRAHDPAGSTLYGVDISVHPQWRGKGIGRALYGERFETVRRLGLRRFGTACRIPGYRASGLSSPEDYARTVESGEARDRTLTPLLRYGLKLVGVIHEYMEDEESADAAALLEWTP